MKYHVAFCLFVAVFIISTATMFLAPLKSAVIDYKPVVSNETPDLIPSDKHASANTDQSHTKENVTANTNVRPSTEELNKETAGRKSARPNKNKRFPETKPATPTPTPTPAAISSELAGLNYINLMCAVISAIGAVFSAIFGYRQDKRYKA